jgi:hypothetical protein
LLSSANAVLKVKLVIEVAGGTQDMASVRGLSLGTSDSVASDSTQVGSSSASPGSVDAIVGRPLITESSATAKKSILSKVRSYLGPWEGRAVAFILGETVSSLGALLFCTYRLIQAAESEFSSAC